ncbi:MAG: hypothetical protein AB8H79_22565 [Myxococcota bacterium]
MATRTLLCLAGLASAMPAAATEVQFEGFYRARARGFSSLSIDAALDDAEPAKAWVQHRLYLAPRFIVSDKVAVFTEFRGLDGVTWGQAPTVERDSLQPFNVNGGGNNLPLAFTDDLRPPGSLTPSGLPGVVPDFSIWRVYGEVHGELGTFRFGRMPIHWGLGIWQNDGLGLNADYGDSADRLQWERAFDDVFLRAAFEVDSQGLFSADDQDAVAGNLAASYRTERVEIGLNTQLRRYTGGGAEPLTVFTGSMAMDAEIGNLRVGAELVGRYGTGELGNLDSATIQSFGGLLVGELDAKPLKLGVDIGVASGDGDSTDDTLGTFSFDRDYNIGILMFEQPMPVFTATDSGGRDLTQSLTGNGVSNAIFARAAASYDLPEDLTANVAVAAARTFRRPEVLRDQTTYGLEVDAGLSYNATEHLELSGTGAFFLPGSYYRNYTDGDTITDGYRGFVLGGQIMGRVSF